MSNLSTLGQNETVAKVLKLLPTAISAALVILFATLLASLFWLLFTPQSPLPELAIPVNTTPEKPVAIKNHGKEIANLHLFGKQEKPAHPAPSEPKPVPVTHLNLELTGIVARKNQRSYAIIAPGKQAEQKIFSVGEEPQPGVVIDRILPRKVILKHAGKIQELKLPEEPVSSTGNLNVPVRSPVIPGNSNYPRINTPVNQVNNVNDLPEDDLAALRDTLTNNPDKILEIANITEAKDKDGNLTGFRLSPGKNRKLFRKLGLRPGDIVMQVNGVQLDSPAKGLMIMNELSSAASISITLKRGDQEVTIEKAF